MRDRPPCQVYYNLGAELSDEEEEEAADIIEVVNLQAEHKSGQAVIQGPNKKEVANTSSAGAFDQPGDRPYDNSGSDLSSDTNVFECSLNHEDGEDVQEGVWDRGSVPPDIIVSAEKFKIIKDEPKKHQTKVKRTFHF